MEQTPANFKTPGQLMEWLLAERGWTKKVLGIVLEMDEAGLSRIISGKRPLSAELAVALEEVFEVPAESFMTLQKSFELAQARIADYAFAHLAIEALGPFGGYVAGFGTLVEGPPLCGIAVDSSV